MSLFFDQSRAHYAWGLYLKEIGEVQAALKAFKQAVTLDEGSKVARGGSYYDRPHRARSAARHSYMSWQCVHNVGFRVVCEDDRLARASVASELERLD